MYSIVIFLCKGKITVITSKEYGVMSSNMTLKCIATFESLRTEFARILSYIRMNSSMTLKYYLILEDLITDCTLIISFIRVNICMLVERALGA
jgi:hypothetical protein